MASTHPKLPEYDQSGLGTRASDQGGRIVNADGTFNVERRGMGIKDRLSFYHSLTTMPLWRFIAVVLSSFFLVNIFFACLYLWVGEEQLTGTQGTTPLARFAEVFFFSAQTITTVGYGHVSPTGISAGIIASLESLLGLMGFAVATGIFYGRFSGPVARMVFSHDMLVAPYRSGTAVMFRVANSMSNNVNDLTCQVLLSWTEQDNAGRETRKYYALPLERSAINFLALSWTVVHPITEESPLYGYTQERFARTDAEFMVILKGWDETSNQQIVRRASYRASELVWGGRFRPMFTRATDGTHTILDLDLLSAYDPAPLPALHTEPADSLTSTR